MTGPGTERSPRQRTPALGLSLAALLVLSMMLVARPAHAATFTVTNTADPGNGTCDAACTLREAITAANTSLGTDTINFNIPDDPGVPGFEVKTVSPTSELPPITDTVTIDGYTQGGAAVNTATTNANNAVLKIELSGRRPNGSRLSASGLTIQASSCLVKGLSIDRFGQHGVEIAGTSSTFNKILGNHIGTNFNGGSAFGNAGDGVRIGNASSTTVGGTSAGARNVISGNDRNGVFISGTNTATFNKIQGNYIGTDASGTGALGNNLGNAEVGVRVETPGNFVGGTASGAGNVISDNAGTGVSILATDVSRAANNRVEGNLIGPDANGDLSVGGNFHGVFVSGSPGNTVGGGSPEAANTISGNRNNGVMILGEAATGNRVLRNSIFGNGSPGGLGIALNNDGVTANDNKDPDVGPNKLQNFPVITSASTATVTGSLNSRPSKTFTIQFFSNPAPNFPTGFGEGEVFLGEKTVTTNDRGRVSFTFNTSVSAGQLVTATATDASGNTSEFSQARVVE